MTEIDGVKVFGEDAPVQLPRAARRSKYYGVAARLDRVGQWFVWDNPPKTLTSIKKTLAKVAPHCEVYRSGENKLVVRCVRGRIATAGAPAVPAAGDVGPKAAAQPVVSPSAAPPVAGRNWSPEQRAAAAERMRQRQAQLQRAKGGLKGGVDG